MATTEPSATIDARSMTRMVTRVKQNRLYALPSTAPTGSGEVRCVLMLLAVRPASRAHA